jgi:uncharacterized protein (TIGR03084 family)
VDLGPLLSSLAEQHQALDLAVATLTEREWALATPAVGWDVRDQVHHLAYFDEVARSVVRDPDAFVRARSAILADPDSYMDAHLALGRGQIYALVLARWRSTREEMIEGFRAMDTSRRIPWFGPDMSARSFITARLMETFAHGQDIADALEIGTISTAGLRDIAHLGVATRAYSYRVREMQAPPDVIRIELLGPSGEKWIWGGSETSNEIIGSALAFALVVTQRRHKDDTDLVVSGQAAQGWLEIAQAFAGPPGAGRRSGQFRLA